jgi:hypothetical protein
VQHNHGFHELNQTEIGMEAVQQASEEKEKPVDFEPEIVAFCCEH